MPALYKAPTAESQPDAGGTCPGGDHHTVIEGALGAGSLGRRKQGLNSCYAIADPTVFEVCASVQERLQAGLSDFVRLEPVAASEHDVQT